MKMDEDGSRRWMKMDEDGWRWMEMDGDGWRWMEMDVSPKCVLLANGVQRNQMAMACKERRAFSNESRPSALQSQPMVHGCANDQSLGTKLHTPFIFGIGL